MSALMRRALWSVEAPEQRVKLIKLDIVRHLLRRAREKESERERERERESQFGGSVHS